MDDESGELMELVEEVPLKELGDAKVERLVRGCILNDIWNSPTGGFLSENLPKNFRDPTTNCICCYTTL